MLGQNLKDMRIRNKYNQEDIAEQLGVTKQTISNWEKGKRTPDIDSLVKDGYKKIDYDNYMFTYMGFNLRKEELKDGFIEYLKTIV